MSALSSRFLQVVAASAAGRYTVTIVRSALALIPMANIASGSSSRSRVATYTSTPEDMSSTISSGTRAAIVPNDTARADKDHLAIQKGRTNNNLATWRPREAHN